MLETVAPAQSEAERGDDARDIIARLRASPDGVDYDEAYERAQAFLAERRVADAQLLYVFAARSGHAPAAFELATQYDPNHFADGTGLADAPDAFLAHRWYREAQAAGHAAAAERLARLRAWAEAAVEAGDSTAEQLLLLPWGDAE